MPYRSFQMASKYLTQAMGLLSNAEKSAGIYSGNTPKRNRQIIKGTNKMAVQAANSAIDHIKVAIEKLGGVEDDDEGDGF